MTLRRIKPASDSGFEPDPSATSDERISEPTLDLASVAAAAIHAAGTMSVSGATSGSVSAPATASGVAPPGSESSRINWRGVLLGASPREVLARVMAGDPLRLRERVADALERHCVLLDGDRVFLRAAARIARFAQRYRGQPELDPWLRGQIDDALLDLLEEDEEAAAANQLTVAEGIAAIARPLGLDPARIGVVCATFNRLELAERRIFRALVLQSRSLDEVVAQFGGSATAVARSARRVLETLMLAARGSQS